MKIVVTGGAGYIGLHIIEKLLTLNHEILVIDNFVTSNQNDLRKVEIITNKKINIFPLDIKKTNHLITILKNFNPNVIIHLAGYKYVSESIKKPIIYYENNVTSTISLLRAMEEVNCNNIIFSSSATVYGIPKYLPYDEEHPKNPTNPYGNSKWMIENILMDWCKGFKNRKALSLRYFNPVGAHKSKLIGEKYKENEFNIMPSICKVIAGKKKQLNIFGNDYDTNDGTAERDYIHILDLTNAHILAIEYLKKINSGYEAFNIGTNKTLSVLQLVQLFEKISGSKIPIKFKPKRKGDLAKFWTNPKKAVSKLKWNPKYSHEEMCLDTWNYINEEKTKK